jgi:hypothetical protein
VVEAPPSAVRPVAEQPFLAVTAAVQPSGVVAAVARPSEVVVAVAQPSGVAAVRPPAVEERPSSAAAVVAAQRERPVAAAVPRPQQVAAHAGFRAAVAVSAQSPRRVATAQRRWAAERPPVVWLRRAQPPVQPASPVRAG